MRMEHWFYAVPLRLRSLFRRQRVEQDLDEELQYHLERKTEEYIAQGLTPGQARQAALRAMDGLTQRKEECRDMRRVNVIDEHASGYPLRPARSCEVSRLYGGRRADAGAGDRRQRRGLRRIERADPAPAECASGGEPLRNRARERTLRARSRIPTISICAIATAASTVWPRIPSMQAGLDTGDNPSRVWLELVSGNYFDVLRHSAVSWPFLPRLR